MRDYLPTEPARSEIDQHSGGLILEFGAAWCGICQAAQPNIQGALAEHPRLHHLKVADGPGQPLGRSFGIKLWPTLIALRDGREVARLVRPTDRQVISQLMAAVSNGADSAAR